MSISCAQVDYPRYKLQISENDKDKYSKSPGCVYVDSVNDANIIITELNILKSKILKWESKQKKEREEFLQKEIIKTKDYLKKIEDEYDNITIPF